MGSSGCWLGCSGGEGVCGCFLLSQGCIYSAYGLISRPPYALVKKYISGIHFEDFHIKVITPANTTVAAGSGLGSSTQVGDYTVDLVSATATGSDTWPRNSIVYATDILAMCDSSDTNEPVAGTIGDIQSGSLVDLIASNPSSVKLAPGIVTSQKVMSKSISYAFSSPGIDSRQSCIQLPAATSAGIWNYEDDCLVLGYTSSSMSVFMVSTASPVIFTRQISVVCPKILKIYDLGGCYGCTGGYQLQVLAYSSCTAGSAQLRVVGKGLGSAPASAMLGLLAANMSLTVWTPRSANTIKVCLSGSSEDCMSVTFVAAYNPSVFPTNGTVVPGIDGGNSFSLIGWFTSGSWWHKLLYALFIAAIIAIGIVLLVALTRLTLALCKIRAMKAKRV